MDDENWIEVPHAPPPQLRADFRAHRYEVDGRDVDLTRQMAILLNALISRGRNVLPRSDMGAVRVTGESATTSAVDQAIRQLRSRLAHPEWIETVRGIGYRWAGPLPDLITDARHPEIPPAAPTFAREMAALRSLIVDLRNDPEGDESNDDQGSVLDVVLADMVGYRDPVETFPIGTGNLRRSRFKGGGDLVTEFYARVYELESSPFLVIVLERITEDVDKLASSTLRSIAGGARDLYTDEEIVDCLGPFVSMEMAQARALAWTPRR